MVKLTRRSRPLALAALVVASALGACSSPGNQYAATGQAPAMSGRDGATEETPVGGRPHARGQTAADRAGAVGPGNTVGTSSVNAVTQSTQTQIDSLPELRPTAGPGSQ